MDECLVSGVDTAAIHLNDMNCFAVQNETNFIIESSWANGCGAVSSFEDDVFVFSNTLHFGRVISNGIVIGRSAAIAFSCKFNSIASVVSSYKSNNAPSSVTFSAGDDNYNVIDLATTFNFYKTAAYQETVDYNTHQTAVGNTLYAQISSSAMIPDTSIIVKNCSVSDDAIASSSVSLVENSCPIESVLDVTLKESNDSAARIEYKSFIFPESADSASMTITCDVQFCNSNDFDCLGGCNGPRDTNMVILLPQMADSYRISGDGKTKTSVTIDAPTDNYAFKRMHAIIKGDLYIFGGPLSTGSYRKIARMDGCSITETIFETLNGYTYRSASLAIDNGEKALICFPVGNVNGQECEIFDTTSSTATHSSQYAHWDGRLAFYKGKPLSVSGRETLNGKTTYLKIETFSELSGWETLSVNSPRDLIAPSLIGLENGALFMAGGYDLTLIAISNDIWILKDEVWTLSSSALKNRMRFGSALKIGNFIYLAYGDDETNLISVERLVVINDEVFLDRIIGSQATSTTDFPFYPIMFEVTTDNYFCDQQNLPPIS
ncbi:Oidioi.mRNA.OKI2018_I69.chr1.g69.t1.cds [Oikopleura dioica]|uniref:Oidioi.mRNA.OKI2018_I69.chr1.g69.t1.cds n=1 Tax=Oikopleura dioica TaxID=34765 RepID=A0ABN7SIP3_OIKDI|nr:Oidioi.mRNA.OKI2018_I69.chr1.g69.t1.cds [Oikopleura dioica]